MGDVDIAFVKKCESWELESRFFPSKIGGKPAWLDLKNLPECSEITCEYCKNQCIFLCQIYAPCEEEDEAFHRTLFIFICKNPNCCKTNANGNLKVFRSQLPRLNEFYPPYPPEENENWRSDIKIERWRKTCHVCGIVASSHCSRCKKTSYCCRAHQVIDWKNAHKKLCGSSINSVSADFLFPEFKLDMEEDDFVDVNNEGDDDDNEIEENKTVLKNMSVEEFQEKRTRSRLFESFQVPSLQNSKNVDLDLIKFANNKEDESFLEFRNRIKNSPDQVIRYDKGGCPLYISSFNHAQNIPKCEECNSERQFEFQIMPQLLYHLNFEDSLRSLDWGIIAIFTCKRSCTPKSGYVAEYIWKQDITEF